MTDMFVTRLSFGAMELRDVKTHEVLYCKGEIKPPHKKQGKRLICSGLAQFCMKGVVSIIEAV